MFISFNPRLPFHSTEIEAITGARNGSFSLQIVKDNIKSLLMYDRFGHSMYEVHREQSLNYGVFFQDGACLLGCASVDSEHKTHVSGKAYLGEVIQFEDAEVFPNDWFVLRIHQINTLFDKFLRIKASGFSKAEVFVNGYALCFDDECSWQLFKPNGKFLREVDRVAGFVGDGLVLVKTDDGSLRLENFEGKTLNEKTIVSFFNYNDDCFVLTTSDGFSRMYASSGEIITVETKDAEFLPDGCFVQLIYGGKMVSAIYKPNGIQDKRSIYTFEVTEKHYLINSEFDKGLLFDANGKELGREFKLIDNAENFAVFEQEGKIKLFNQYGQVLETEVA